MSAVLLFVAASGAALFDMASPAVTGGIPFFFASLPFFVYFLFLIFYPDGGICMFRFMIFYDLVYFGLVIGYGVLILYYI